MQIEITDLTNDGETNSAVYLILPILEASSLLGGLIGATITKHFGSKRCFLLSPILGAGSVTLMWLMEWTESYSSVGIFFSQSLVGIYAGLNHILVPMYLVEISPLNLRGAFGIFHQFSLLFGVLTAHLMQKYNLLLYSNSNYMPNISVTLLIVLLLLGAQLSIIPFCAESPRYLFITKQQEDEARNDLHRLRSSHQIENEIEEMRSEQRSQLSHSIPSTLKLSYFKKLSMPLLITVVLQLVGLDVFTHNTWILFTLAGFPDSHRELAHLGVKIVQLIMVFISMLVIDRVGRRKLLLCSIGGMFITSVFFTLSLLLKISYAAVFFKLSFELFYSSGVGCITQFITAELFTQGPRPMAMFIAYLSSQLHNFVGFILYLKINTQTIFGKFILIPFSLLLALFFVFVHKFFPETKNKTFGDIFTLLQHKALPSDDMVVVFKHHADEQEVEDPPKASTSYRRLT